MHPTDAYGYKRAPVRSLIALRSSVPLPRLLVWVAALMLFFLTATNGRPLWWSSTIPSVVFATFLLLERGPQRALNASLSRYNKPITITLLLLMVATALAIYPDTDFVTLQALLFRCVIPYMIYISLVGVTLRRNDIALLIAAIALGSTFMFTRGALAFYAEWGIPDLDTVLWARYNKERIASYGDATVGNVGHMGAYVVLVLPALICCAIFQVKSWLARGGLAAVVLLGLANLIVSGSRTGIVISLFSLVLILLCLGLRRAGIILLLLFVGSFMAFTDVGDSVVEEQLIQRFAPSLSSRGMDRSAEERYESVVIGWQVFLDHPFLGIGPDMSREYNYYTVPHESLVHVLSEIGAVGGMIFLFLNVLTIGRACISSLRTGRSEQEKWRMLWLIGPASWLLLGLVGGITFNLSLALLWVGIAHAMLALAGATVVEEPNTRGQDARQRMRPSAQAPSLHQYGRK